MPAPLNICFLSSVVPRGLQRGPSVGLGRVVAVCQKETNTIPAELCRIASCTISRARSWLQAAPNSRGWCALHRPRSCYHRPSEWLSTNPFDPIGARESRHPAFPRSVPASMPGRSLANVPSSPLPAVLPSPRARTPFLPDGELLASELSDAVTARGSRRQLRPEVEEGTRLLR